MSAGISFSLEIQDAELKQHLSTMEARGKNLAPFLKKSALIMDRSFAQNFRNEGRPKKWRSLSRNTIAARRKGSSRILQDTGRLRLSVISRSAPGNIRTFSKDSLKMGTRMTIAPYHQYGTRPYTIVPKNAKALSFITAAGRIFVKRVRHPGLSARPFVLIQREDEQAMMQVALDHIEGK